MGLMKILSAGRKLVGLRGGRVQYRVAIQKVAPDFSSPFRSVRSKEAGSGTGRGQDREVFESAPRRAMSAGKPRIRSTVLPEKKQPEPEPARLQRKPKTEEQAPVKRDTAEAGDRGWTARLRAVRVEVARPTKRRMKVPGRPVARRRLPRGPLSGRPVA